MKRDEFKELDDFSSQDIYELRHSDTPLIQFQFFLTEEDLLQTKILWMNQNQNFLFPRDLVISPLDESFQKIGLSFLKF